MRTVETSAETRKEAIQKALGELDVELHEVEIEILDEGSRGFLGFGKRDVKVKVGTEVEGAPPKRENRPNRQGRKGRQDRPERQGKAKGERQGDRGGRQAKGERQGKGERQSKSDRKGTKERQGQGGRGEEKEHQPKAERQPKPQPKPKPERKPRPERKPKPERQPEAARAEKPERRPEPAVPLEPVSESFRAESTAILSEVIGKMGFDVTIDCKATDDGGVYLNVHSPDSAILIGRKGRSLSALQYLVNRMMRAGEHAGEAPERIIVDIEGYLDRRKASLEEMAHHLAAKAKSTGRNMRVKPLDPQERRIIHVALQDDEDLRTFSVGESLYRTVIIAPKNAKRPDEGRGRRGRGDRGRRRNAPRPRDDDQQDNGETNGDVQEAKDTQAVNDA